MAPKKRKLPAKRARTQRVVERDVLTGEAPAFVRSCNAAGERICGACLLPLEPEDKVGATDNCTHIFHYECVEKWSQTENSCPQCKVRFFWMAAYGSDHQRQSLMKVESKDQEEQEEEEFEEVSICEKCKEVGDEAKLLLCDGMHGTCNATFHYTCVGLSGVPRGSWFCPDCTDRGFDIDGRGRRGSRVPRAAPGAVSAAAAPASAPVEKMVEMSAPAPAPVMPPPPVEAAAAAAAPVSEGQGAGGVPCAPGTPAPSESSRRNTRNRLPSQLQLSSLACLTPAVEVPTFQAGGPARPAGQAPAAGLFATFAARRRAKMAGAEEKGSFISLNPTYEEDFMANQKAGG
eukprot:s17_g26.t1